MTTEKVRRRRLLLEAAGLRPPPKQSPRRNEGVRARGRQSLERQAAESVPVATAVVEPAEEEADTPNVAEEVAETVIVGLGVLSLADGLPHDRSIAKILRFKMSERRLRSEGLFIYCEPINPFTSIYDFP